MKSLHLSGKGTDEVIEVLRETLRSLRFGSIEIVVHDGRVVQIDRKEKLRFQSTSEAEAPSTPGCQVK